MNRKTLLGVAGSACVASLAFYSLQAANTTPSQPAKPDAASQPASPDGGPKRFHKPFDNQWGRDCQRGPSKFHRGGPDRRGGPGFDHGRGGPDTLRALNLTDEQKAKVKAVIEGDRAKVEAILKEQREKIEAVKAESEKAIRPILTEEQQSVFDDANKLREAGEKLRNDIRKLHADKDKAPKSQ